MAKVEIEYARMHTTIFAPSIGQLGPELSSVANATHKAVAMSLEGEILTCQVKNDKGKLRTVLIPLANFTNLVVKDSQVAKDNKA